MQVKKYIKKSKLEFSLSPLNFYGFHFITGNQSFLILWQLCLPGFFNKIVYKHKYMWTGPLHWDLIGHMSVRHLYIGNVVSSKLDGIGHVLFKTKLFTTPKSCVQWATRSFIWQICTV